MGSGNPRDILASYNGSLYFSCDSINRAKRNIGMVNRFTYEKENGMFVMDGSIDSQNIAQHAQCCLMRRYSDFTSWTEKFAVVVRNENSQEYDMFQIANNRLHRLYGFSTDDIANATPLLNCDSELKTQVFPLTYTHSHQQSSRVDNFSNHNRILILDGPTLVLFMEKEIYFKPYYEGFTCKTFNVARAFNRAKFDIREYCLLWIGVIDNHIVMLGKEMDGEYKIKLSSDLCSSVAATQRTFTAVRTLETGVEHILSKDFIPYIYDDIILCINVNNIYAVDISDNGCSVVREDSALPSFYHSDIYMCTAHKQLLHLQNGHVQNCVDIPTDCAVQISKFETFCDETYLVIWSADKQVILVKQTSFQVVQVINDVRSILIDDFVLNGAEQLLMLLNTSAEQIVKSEESWNLTDYILTDCEGVHQESGINNSLFKRNGDGCSQSVCSAIRALKMRQQVAVQALFEAEQLLEIKQEVMHQTCHAFKQNNFEGDPECLPKLVNSAVKFLDTENVEQGERGSSVHMLKRVISGQQVTKTDNSVQFSSPTAAGNGHTESPKVLETWHRMISPDCLIVGVVIHNTTGCQMENVTVSLVDTHVDFSHPTDRVYKSVAVNVTEKTEIRSMPLTEQSAKKPRKSSTLDVQGISVLPKGCTCYVLAQTSFPMFGDSATKTFRILLMWNFEFELDTLCYQDCGELQLNVDEMCSLVHSLNPEDLFSSVCMDVKTAVCLEAVQKTKRLRISCLFSDWHSHLDCALNMLGFKFASQLNTYICDRDGPLQWIRVQVHQSKKQMLDVDVSVRNDNQLVLLTHALYSKLPNDVIIEILNQHELSSAISVAVQYIHQELTLSELQLAELIQTVSTSDEQTDVTSMDRTHIQTSFEKYRDRITQRQHYVLEKTKFEQLLTSWKEASQLTDQSISFLVNILKV